MLSWGIAATGGIARTVGKVIAAEPGMRVAAVGSRDLDRARAFAAELATVHSHASLTRPSPSQGSGSAASTGSTTGSPASLAHGTDSAPGLPRAYGSYAELVLDPDVDVVYIATPQSHHLPVAELAIAAGRAVLCEKPLAATAADAERMVKLAREAGVFLMEAMWMRFNPLVRRLHRLVRDGAFGDLRTVSASFGFALPDDPAHRLWDPALGGGALLDLGIYPMGLAQLLLGEPDEMTVTGAVAPSGVDAEAGLLMAWNGGARALLDTSLVSPLAITASIAGTLMRAELDAPFFATRRMVLHGPQGQMEEHLLEEGDDGYVGEIREVRDALSQGRTESTVMPLDDSLAMMRLIEKARTAVHQRGQSPLQ